MSKYGNEKVVIDGIEFDSKKEGNYYLFLKQKEQAGEISNLRLQVPYEIIPAVWGTKIEHLKTKTKEKKYCIQRATQYFADFVYVVTKTGRQEVVDVKSEATAHNAEFRLKKKMLFAFCGVDIIVVLYDYKRKRFYVDGSNSTDIL